MEAFQVAWELTLTPFPYCPALFLANEGTLQGRSSSQTCFSLAQLTLVLALFLEDRKSEPEERSNRSSALPSWFSVH